MNALILLFYRIVTFFTRVPAKTRASHTLLRASKLSDNTVLSSYYINRQADLADIPYGTGDLGLNGCGPIALFNAVRALDEDNSKFEDVTSNISLSSIVDYLELKGAAFGGKLGTSPHMIDRFLKLRGYTTKIYSGKNSTKLNNFSKEFEAFISLIYNDSKSIKKGLHFICTKKNVYGSFTTHNPDRTGDSLFKALNMCSQDEIRHVCTIGIKK